MRDRAYRYLPIATLGFAMLLGLPGLAVADESPRAPRGADRAAADLPPQAKACGACVAAQKLCTASCFGLQEKTGIAGCLMGCDNAAATCTCDGQATLRSEDIRPRPDLFGAKAAACNSTTLCGTEYASCATWSGYYNCGDPFCGFARGCGDCEDFPCPGPALKQYQERYQVCFNAQGQSCTQYQRLQLNLGCGC